MKICSICQGENPDKAKKCISCGNKFKKPIYKRGWFICLIIFCIFRVNSEINSIKREKEIYNNSNVDVKGVFVLNDDWISSDEKFMDLSNELKNEETYMLLVYDLINDTTDNISLYGNVFIKLNDENQYDKIENLDDYINNFKSYSGYKTKIPSQVGALSEPVRVLEVFKVNKYDIHESTTMEIYFDLSRHYEAKVNFKAQDIIPISYFDYIFQVEAFPKEYQEAQTVYIRLLETKEYLNNNKLFRNNILGMAGNYALYEVNWTVPMLLINDISDDPFIFDITEGTFDILGVKKIYPEIYELLEQIVDNGKLLMEISIDGKFDNDLHETLIETTDELIKYFEDNIIINKSSNKSDFEFDITVDIMDIISLFK